MCNPFFDTYIYFLIWWWQVAEEIWVCANGTVSKWQGDIFSYKQSLIDAIETRKSKEKKKAAANQK